MNGLHHPFPWPLSSSFCCCRTKAKVSGNVYFLSLVSEINSLIPARGIHQLFQGPNKQYLMIDDGIEWHLRDIYYIYFFEDLGFWLTANENTQFSISK